MKNLLLLVSALIIIVIPAAAESGTLEITSDLSSVPVYIDDEYIGTTPLEAGNISPGPHLVQASPEGLFTQIQNISVNTGEVTKVVFTFSIPEEAQIPAMIRIGECVGTPQPSNLDGTALDLLRLSDGSLMAYYSGWEHGIQCMASRDGLSWDKIPDSCLDVSEKGSDFKTEPWVFVLPDGSYRMIYRQTNGEEHTLNTASSSDGIQFEGDEQVLAPGEAGFEKDSSPSVPSGVVYPDGTIRMYYQMPGTGIQSAISDDMGITWKEEDGVRVTHGTDPTIVVLSDGKTGIFYVDTTPKSKGQRIFFAQSDDGLDFSPYRPVQVLETTEPGVWLMDPEIIERDGTEYLYFSVMGIEGMHNHVLPGTLRSVINLDCIMKEAVRLE